MCVLVNNVIYVDVTVNRIGRFYISNNLSKLEKNFMC